MPTRELRFTDSFVRAAAEIAGLNGRVPHRFTDRVFVVEFPDGTDSSNLRASQQVRPDGLDSMSLLAAAAWQAPAREVSAEPAADEGLVWDAPGMRPPDLPAASGITGDRALRYSNTPTSLYLTGSVAIGVVIVSGPTSNLQFSDAEKQDVLAEIVAGLNFLDAAEPRAKLSFSYDLHPLTVSAQPCPDPNIPNWEACEAPWRDAAMAQLGYPVVDKECGAYANALKAQKNTNWAYVALITKYPLAWYAYSGATKVSIQYGASELWPSKLNRVFAHETCHVFGASDEYASSKCTCVVSGFLNVPNNNCENCAGQTHVACLMNQNTLSLCQWTRRQVGWDASLFPEAMDMRNYVPTGMKTGDTGRWDLKGIWWTPWKAVGSSATVTMLSKTELHLAGPYDLLGESGQIDIHIWGFQDNIRFCSMQVIFTGPLAGAFEPNANRFDSGVQLVQYTEGLPGTVAPVPYIAYGSPASVTQGPYSEETFWYPSIVFYWTRPDGSVAGLAFEDTAL